MPHKRRFSIAAWTRAHPRAAARARRKAQLARRSESRSLGTRTLEVARKGPRNVFRVIFEILASHERRIRVLEGR